MSGEERAAFCEELADHLADAMESIGIEDATTSDGRDLADTVYCLGYRKPGTCDHEPQIHDLLTEREELLTEIRRLRMGRHPAGRALRAVDEAAWRDLQVALDARDAEHEGGGGA